MFTFKELRLFYALCETPHINQVSKIVFLSQSAISLAIKSLEGKMGEPLFDRIGKKIILNDAGKRFRQVTYPHYLALIEAKNLFRQNKVEGTLKVASSRTIGNYLLPVMAFDFISRYPDATIQRSTSNSEAIVKQVIEGKVDLGFIEAPCSDPLLILKKIGRDELIVVTKNPYFKNKKVSLESILNKKWIIREPGSGTREAFIGQLGDNANEINLFMGFNEFEEAKTLCGLDEDIMMCISALSVQKELHKGELNRVHIKDFCIKRDFLLIYHKEKQPTQLFTTFIDHAESWGVQDSNIV